MHSFKFQHYMDMDSLVLIDFVTLILVNLTLIVCYTWAARVELISNDDIPQI